MTVSGHVAVLVDSSAGVEADLARRWNLGVVPLAVEFGDMTYLDGEVPARAWRSTTDGVVRTSPPTPGAFLTAIREVLAAGAESAVVLTASASISSGTYHAALAAAHALRDGEVVVLDVGQAAGALALTGARAAAVAALGANQGEVVDAARTAAARTTLLLAVDRDFLARSARRPASVDPGRSSPAAVPLLTLTAGALELCGSAGSFEDAAVSILDRVRVRARPGPGIRGLVMHGPDASIAERLRTGLGDLVGEEHVAVSRVSDAIVVNAGPSVAGVAVLDGG